MTHSYSHHQDEFDRDNYIKCIKCDNPCDFKEHMGYKGCYKHDVCSDCERVNGCYECKEERLKSFREKYGYKILENFMNLYEKDSVFKKMVKNYHPV